MYKIKQNVGSEIYEYIRNLDKKQAKQMLSDVRNELKTSSVKNNKVKYSKLKDQEELLLITMGYDRPSF